MREWDFTRDENSLRIRICEWGVSSDDNPTIVICHGYLEQAAAWDRVAKAIGAHIIAPDHRGHGLSEHVGRGSVYHFWDYVSDLDALISSLGKPIVLVGHSMGGSIATLYSGLRPENVLKRVLIEGLGPPDSTVSAVGRARQFLTGLEQGPAHPPLLSIEDGIQRMQRWNPNLSHTVAHKLVSRSTKRTPDGVLIWTWDPKHRLRSPTPFSWKQFEQFLGRYNGPTLLIRGATSRFLPKDMQTREAAVPNRQLCVIEQAGHLIHHDQPLELARIMTHFISEN